MDSFQGLTLTHHGIDLWLQVQIFYDHVNPVTRRTIDQSAGGKLRDLNAKESWALLEDLALYDNESWNDPRDFAKPVKAIALPQDVPSTSRPPIELENQDTQYYMEDPEQAFVEYTSSRTDEACRFGFFLQMGFTLILATLDGLDVGLLGDVIGGDDCDDDE
ncbi:hypothetical protein Tco_0619259 [Tanacetum coccineum]